MRIVNIAFLVVFTVALPAVAAIVSVLGAFTTWWYWYTYVLWVAPMWVPAIGVVGYALCLFARRRDEKAFSFAWAAAILLFLAVWLALNSLDFWLCTDSNLHG